MTLISDSDVLRRRVDIPLEDAISLWKDSKWEEIGDGLCIDPFDSGNLAIGMYDLSVGSEYVSLRDPDTVNTLDEGERIELGPGETVLILTQEYIALPRTLAALIVPRARWIFQGAAINATRVDPTWYGKLLIGFTNLSKFPFVIGRAEPFCTCLFMEARTSQQSLADKGVGHLGRKSIGRIDTPNIKPSHLREPDEIRRNEMREVVQLFGPPFDIVRGTIEREREEIIAYISAEVAPDIVADARAQAKEEAFDKLFQLQQSWLTWQKMFVATIIAVFSAFVGFLIWFGLYGPR